MSAPLARWVAWLACIIGRASGAGQQQIAALPEADVRDHAVDLEIVADPLDELRAEQADAHVLGHRKLLADAAGGAR